MFDWIRVALPLCPLPTVGSPNGDVLLSTNKALYAFFYELHKQAMRKAWLTCREESRQLQHPFENSNPSLASCLFNSLFWRRGFLLLWHSISMVLQYERKCSAGFKICRGKCVSLRSFYVSVTLALSENAFSLLVPPTALCPSQLLEFFIVRNNMDAFLGLTGSM